MRGGGGSSGGRGEESKKTQTMTTQKTEKQKSKHIWLDLFRIICLFSKFRVGLEQKFVKTNICETGVFQDLEIHVSDTLCIWKKVDFVREW